MCVIMVDLSTVWQPGAVGSKLSRRTFIFASKRCCSHVIAALTFGFTTPWSAVGSYALARAHFAALGSYAGGGAAACLRAASGLGASILAAV